MWQLIASHSPYLHFGKELEIWGSYSNYIRKSNSYCLPSKIALQKSNLILSWGGGGSFLQIYLTLHLPWKTITTKGHLPYLGLALWKVSLPLSFDLSLHWEIPTNLEVHIILWLFSLLLDSKYYFIPYKSIYSISFHFKINVQEHKMHKEEN